MTDQPQRAGGRPERPLCSIIIVNFNGRRFLQECIASVLAVDYPADRLEVLLVDNGSQDGSAALVRNTFPSVRVLWNLDNNYAKALNVGLGAARGDLIGFVNNDAVLDRRWLLELVSLFDEHEKLGCAGGKIFLDKSRLHSAGLEETPEGFFRDRGPGEAGMATFDAVAEVPAVRGTGVLYRRAALEAVGPMDEDFVIYWEDIDYAYRLRKLGWKILYTPHARLRHAFQGGNVLNRLAYYFCDRNRLLYTAKHYPYRLAWAVRTSAAYKDAAHDMLFEFMAGVFKKLLSLHDAEVLKEALPDLVRELSGVFGARRIENLLARMEVALGYRKPKIGIYDHALHFVGGGQKYVCTMAAILQERYDVTYIANKPVTLAQLSQWYDLDLSKCHLKIIPLPFYEARRSEVIHASMVMGHMPNPFLAISEESSHYDFFINANMLSKCPPLSNRSLFICHFPDVNPGPYFAAHRYTHIITNGQYTTHWLEKRWGMRAHRVIYPPVDMYGASSEGTDPLRGKESIILSVARFEDRGTKKQKALVKAFNMLCRRDPDRMRSWRLWLVGGTVPGVPYIKEVRRAARSNPRIEIKTNVSLSELRRHYARASIFWHACGLGVDEEKEPELIEHFGMTTVEAMQNYCAPVVINGGGQREIVEHETSGFLFRSQDELCDYTYRLIADPALLHQVMRNAYARSHQFNLDRFARETQAFFDALEREYITLENPRIEYIQAAY